MYKKLIPIATIAILTLSPAVSAFDIIAINETTEKISISHMEKFTSETNPIDLHINKYTSSTIIPPEGYGFFSSIPVNGNVIRVTYERGYLFIKSTELIDDYETSIDIVFEKLGKLNKEYITQKINIISTKDKIKHPQVLKLFKEDKYSRANPMEIDMSEYMIAPQKEVLEISPDDLKNEKNAIKNKNMDKKWCN